MTEWKRICCAVDFEAPSRAAMEEAAELAKRFGAELTLAHVVVRPPPAASDVLVATRERMQVEKAEAEETLARWRADAAELLGRAVSAHLLMGDPALEIVRLTRKEQSDLLVVGTHGRTGLSRLVLGSVAERVARQARCRVLVVHDHAAVEAKELAEEIAQYT